MYIPPPSVPIATEHNPDETNAAGPDEEPPVYLSTEWIPCCPAREVNRK